MGTATEKCRWPSASIWSKSADQQSDVFGIQRPRSATIFSIAATL
jgi:hypothetical protein